MDPNGAARTSEGRHRGLRSDPKTLELAQPPPRFAAAGRCVAPSTAPPSRRPSRPRARHVLWQAAALLLAPEDLLHQRLHVRVLGPRGGAAGRGGVLGAQHRAKLEHPPEGGTVAPPDAGA